MHPSELREIERKQERRIDESFEPDYADVAALNFAIRAYNDFHRFGLPSAGGLNDQPYLWKMAVECVTAAIEDARAEADFRREMMAG